MLTAKYTVHPINQNTYVVERKDFREPALLPAVRAGESVC